MKYKHGFDLSGSITNRVARVLIFRTCGAGA